MSIDFLPNARRTNFGRSYAGLDKDILAEKLATMLRKGATIREAASKHGISDSMVRHMSASYGFSLPTNKGAKNWPAKDDYGLKDDTTYDWARRNWERSVQAARDAGVSEAYKRSWDMQAPAVWYDECVPATPKAASAAEVIRQVCTKYSISKEALVGQSRAKSIMPARHEAAFRIVVEAGLSYPQAGRAMGGRDHTTVLNSIRRHAASSPIAMCAYREFQAKASTSFEELAALMIKEHFEKGVSITQLCKRHSVSRIRAMQVLLDEAERRRSAEKNCGTREQNSPFLNHSPSGL